MWTYHKLSVISIAFGYTSVVNLEVNGGVRPCYKKAVNAQAKKVIEEIWF